MLVQAWTQVPTVLDPLEMVKARCELPFPLTLYCAKEQLQTFAQNIDLKKTKTAVYKSVDD